MFFRHPSKRALREWLEAASEERSNESVDEHLATCHRCAAILDEMEDNPEATISDFLATLYSAPPDLSDRLERRVSARLDSRVVLGLVSDLFGAGVDTSKLLLMEEPERE